MFPHTHSGLYLFDVYVHEPGSLLTNALIVICALWLTPKMMKFSQPNAQLWALFVAGLGIAAFGGIFTHGFPLLFTEIQFYSLWVVKNVFILLANGFAAVALWRTWRDKAAPVNFKYFLCIKALVALIGMIFTLSFTPVVIDLAFTYVLALSVTASKFRIGQGHSQLFYAFAVAFFSGFLYLKPWYVHVHWLTNSDVVHILALWSMWLIYRSTKHAERSRLAFSQAIAVKPN